MTLTWLYKSRFITEKSGISQDASGGFLSRCAQTQQDSPRITFLHTNLTSNAFLPYKEDKVIKLKPELREDEKLQSRFAIKTPS